MAPPPVTPSPRRFVLKSSTSSTSRPSPSQAQILLPSTQQFNSTPRFSLSQARRPVPPLVQVEPSPSLGTRLASTAFPPTHVEDSIEDDGSADVEGIHDSIETTSYTETTNQNEDKNELYAIDLPHPKRQRLSSLSIENTALAKTTEHDTSGSPSRSSPTPIISSPTAPSTQKPHPAAPRFVLPSQLPPSTPHPIKNSLPLPTQDQSNSITPFSKPPRFRPPDPDAATNIEPLPDAFSPHRRGQKYLPGGLAAEVRDWLVNLESTPLGRYRKGEWTVRIVVDEVKSGGGMVVVRGRHIRDEEDRVVDDLGSVKVILAGDGIMEGLKKSVVVLGSVVGIKGPMWEVFVKGERWGVGVEWKAL